MTSKTVYLDYAAATPLSHEARTAMEPYLGELFYNPSAQYLAAQNVRGVVERSRAQVARILGAKPSEIVFTAGGTESDNLAVHGVMRQYPDANCVVSAVEHDAVLNAAAQYSHRHAPVKTDGRVDIEKLKACIDEQTVLVSIMYVNNELGTVQPIAEIAKIIKDIVWQRVKSGNTLPLYFHSDAAQAPNYLHVLVHTLGVDLMSLNAGKIYGPKATGLLYVKTGISLTPLVYGGGQERSLRSGTENVANIVGFATALQLAQEQKDAAWMAMVRLKALMYDLLTKALPGVVINGSQKQRIPNNVHLTIPGQDNERLMMALDEQGIMVAAGSACSASSDEPSHVLRAIGMSDEDARSSLRVSMGKDTTEDDMRRFVQVLATLCN